MKAAAARPEMTARKKAAVLRVEVLVGLGLGLGLGLGVGVGEVEGLVDLVQPESLK